jgi:hypothetical protein
MELIGPISQQAIRTLATQRIPSSLIKETTPYTHSERRGGGGINFTVALSPNGLCSIYDHKFENRFLGKSHSLIGVWKAEGTVLTIQAIFYRHYESLDLENPDGDVDYNYDKEVQEKTYCFEVNGSGDLVMIDNQFINCDAVAFPCVLQKFGF